MFNPSHSVTAPVGHWGADSPNPLRRFAPSLVTFGSVFLIYTTSKASPYGPNRYPSSRATL